MNYQETVDYLYSQLPAFQKTGEQALKPKLANITDLCQYLGNPQNNFKSIHVAGTNGKGSSSHFIASILMEAGYKVGLYTSPHLKDYRERFKINGEMIPEDYVIRFVARAMSKFENLRPSFFEVSVAMAFNYFSDEEVDVAIIETGLGGRLDSTNIISNVLLSHITNIGFDHVNVLGETLEQIAYEKAGIIKRKVPVVISEYLKDTKPVFSDIANVNHSKIIFAQDHYTVENINEDLDSLNLVINSQLNNQNYELQSGLMGNYQINNIRGVIASMELLSTNNLLSISKENIKLGIQNVVKNTTLKGRWQILGYEPFIVCDTGHNAPAFENTIQKLFSGGFEQFHFVLGFVRDKNLTVLKNLIPPNSRLYLNEINSPRSYNIDDLKTLEFINAKNISYFSDVNLALADAIAHADEKDCIFIGGSTYLIAELDNI